MHMVQDINCCNKVTWKVNGIKILYVIFQFPASEFLKLQMAKLFFPTKNLDFFLM
jgi:high-affinity Fe2+/Pb2+ permease